MSGYNLILHPLICPRCGFNGAAEAEFRFGLMEFRAYRVGEKIDWGLKGLRFPASRPSNGEYEGEGYVQCVNCGKDYWVIISVAADMITSVTVDREKEGYIE
ncbi:hypothetical protein OG196_09440 [Kitasatospora purpeofusca]|uniref:hypothetical protein n=1 Tax=Kitasatospora purpeofusca TaxID=67352 RepID=UPI002E111631|nr:hypothetical protein OG196_09440 [Kitasatospora purpeofusca]